MKRISLKGVGRLSIHRIYSAKQAKQRKSKNGLQILFDFSSIAIVIQEKLFTILSNFQKIIREKLSGTNRCSKLQL